MIGSHQRRSDIQALRALAVTAVVTYHLWPNRLPGGFVGVDVFFVISGFLITGHLLREVERSGRIGLTAFWAARARRLLPASLLTLLVTAVAVLVWVPRSLWDQFLGEIGASAAYAQNWLLAADAVDYLAAENRASPVQHFWSLSVEEQFYLALPLVMTVGVLLAAVVRIDRGRVIVALLVVITAASFVHSVMLTGSDPGTAYFSTFTRMWEFGIGGLAATASPPHVGLAPARRRAHVALTVVGIGAIGESLLVIDGGTAFPGRAAALPVIGTALVLRWGATTFASAVGDLAPVSLLGRISYAVYLWHWPMIVILPFITLRDLTTVDKLVIVAATLAVAWASTVLFEEPLRFSWAPRVRPRMVLVGTVAAMVPVLALSVGGRLVVAQDRDASRADLSRLLAEPPPCFGAAAMAPGGDGCSNPELDGTVVPTAAQAFDDDGNDPRCWSTYTSGELTMCSVGPKDGYTVRLAAVGDSHNNALISAYEAIAESNGWRIDIAGHAACYWTTAVQRQDNDEQARTCDEWKAALAAHLSQAGRYDAVITTHATSLSLRRPPDGVTQEQATVDGLVEAWTTQVPAGTPVIALVDNPQTQKGNQECIDRFGTTDPDRCATPRGDGFRKFDGSAEAVARVPRASLVDMTDFYCDRTVCPSVIGGVNVYRDQTHLTDTYVTTLAPYLGDRVRAALRARGVI